MCHDGDLMPAIPYNDTAVVDQPWDAGAAQKNLKDDAGKATYEKVYAWVEAGANPNVQASYKLPHHEVASDGTPGAANVNGVRNALSRLNQSDTQIPDGDKAGVRSHLQKHLDKFNQNKSGQALAGTMILTEGKVWAVRAELMPVLEGMHGKVFSADVEAAGLRASVKTQGNGVAVVPLQGMITPQASLLSILFGGGDGSLASFRSNLMSAIADPDVRSVVLDIDSPGGLVDGVPEMAAEMQALRGATDKPIVAVANTLAASAAYWLASQAHEVVVTPSGEAGSIGVYQLHRDVSGAMEQMGIRNTLISAGKFKVEGNPYEPLNSEAVAAVQQAVDDYYEMFTADVAAGRAHPAAPVTQEDVTGGYGEGRTLTAKRAVKANLADRVATLSDTVQRLSSGRSKVRRTAQDEGVPSQADNGRWVPTPEERDRLVTVLAQLR